YISLSVLVVYISAVGSKGCSEKIPMVARVSIVDYWGHTILDTYVRPTHYVEDYSGHKTGLKLAHLENAPLFELVQLRVAEIIKGKVMIGHTLWTALSVLGLSHPALYTRDLALFWPLRKKLKSRSIIDLPTLVQLFMCREVGMGYEDSLELSRSSLDLFRCCEELFERIIVEGAWPCNLPPSAYAQYFT
ncbi:hypothetical protein BDZ94DRAFT_1171645, partial [Collybia nuda]